MDEVVVEVEDEVVVEQCKQLLQQPQQEQQLHEQK